jgi:hypothetical protein
MSIGNNNGGRKRDLCWTQLEKTDDPKNPGAFVWLCKSCGVNVSPRVERIKLHLQNCKPAKKSKIIETDPEDDEEEEGVSASARKKSLISDFFIRTTEADKKVIYHLTLAFCSDIIFKKALCPTMAMKNI